MKHRICLEELKHSETRIIDSGTSSESAFGGTLEHVGLRLALRNTGCSEGGLAIVVSRGGKKKRGSDMVDINRSQRAIPKSED